MAEVTLREYTAKIAELEAAVYTQKKRKGERMRESALERIFDFALLHMEIGLVFFNFSLSSAS